MLLLYVLDVPTISGHLSDVAYSTKAMDMCTHQPSLASQAHYVVIYAGTRRDERSYLAQDDAEGFGQNGQAAEAEHRLHALSFPATPSRGTG